MANAVDHRRAASVAAGAHGRLYRLGRRLRPQTRIAWLFATPMVAVFIAFVVIPVINTVYLSFFHANQLIGVQEFLGLDNYSDAVTASEAGTILMNTLVWTVGSLVGQIGLGLVAALIVNQPLRFSGFFRSILIMPYVIPAIALALIWRWIADGQYGIVSYLLQSIGFMPPGQSPLTMSGTAMVAVIVANVWRAFPFAMLVYWAALQSIDPVLYEAARIDGAGTFQRFRYVTAPALRGTTVALIVLRGIWTVTYFDLIWLVTQGGPAGETTTWTILIYNAAIGSSNLGYASALGVIMAVVLLVVVIAYTTFDRKSSEPGK
jgi:multiple sugar transport system permease protein